MHNATEILEVIYDILANNEVTAEQKAELTKNILYIDYDKKDIEIQVRDTVYTLTLTEKKEV